MTQELEDVADDVDDTDPELISDHEQHEGGPQGDAGATRTRSTGSAQIVIAMNAFENLLGAEINIEREERKKEAASVND